MAAYSQDLRERVLRAYERGEPATAIARRLEVSESWVHGVCQRYRETGERTAHRIGGYRVSCLEPWRETILGWIAEQPDLTLAEMVERLGQNGVEVVVGTLWHQLNRWELTYKKKPARPRAGTP
jgi:transposase